MSSRLEATVSSAAEQDVEVWNEPAQIPAGDQSAQRRDSASSSREKCGRVISSRRENPYRLEAFLSHRYVDTGAGQCGWKKQSRDRPDASNLGVDERVLLCCADGLGAVHRQAGDKGNKELEASDQFTHKSLRVIPPGNEGEHRGSCASCGLHLWSEGGYRNSGLTEFVLLASLHRMCHRREDG